jgi:hypothetical protein
MIQIIAIFKLRIYLLRFGENSDQCYGLLNRNDETPVVLPPETIKIDRYECNLELMHVTNQQSNQGTNGGVFRSCRFSSSTAQSIATYQMRAAAVKLLAAAVLTMLGCGC